RRTRGARRRRGSAAQALRPEHATAPALRAQLLRPYGGLFGDRVARPSAPYELAVAQRTRLSPHPPWRGRTAAPRRGYREPACAATAVRIRLPGLERAKAAHRRRDRCCPAAARACETVVEGGPRQSCAHADEQGAAGVCSAIRRRDVTIHACGYAVLVKHRVALSSRTIAACPAAQLIAGVMRRAQQHRWPAT